MPSEVILGIIGLFGTLLSITFYLVKAIGKKTENLAEESQKVSHESLLRLDLSLAAHDKKVDRLDVKLSRLVEKVEEVKVITIESRQKLASAFNDIRTVDKVLNQLDDQVRKILEKHEAQIEKIRTEVVEIGKDVVMIKTRK